MTKHAFLEGMGLGVLAGAAIAIAVAATPNAKRDMRRMARRTTRHMDKMKSDLTDAMGL